MKTWIHAPGRSFQLSAVRALLIAYRRGAEACSPDGANGAEGRDAKRRKRGDRRDHDVPLHCARRGKGSSASPAPG